MPAVLVVLAMSIFPLLVSLYLSLARFKFVKGGFELKFIGLLNYKKLLLGSEQFHFLGTFGELSAAGWAVLGVVAVGLIALLVRYARAAGSTLPGLLGRSVASAGAFLLVLLIVLTNSGGGHPGQPGGHPVLRRHRRRWRSTASASGSPSCARRTCRAARSSGWCSSCR